MRRSAGTPVVSDRAVRDRQLRAASGGLAIVILQQATEPFLAADRSLAAADALALLGKQQDVSFALMIPLLVIMDDELGERPAERGFAQ